MKRSRLYWAIAAVCVALLIWRWGKTSEDAEFEGPVELATDSIGVDDPSAQAKRAEPTIEDVLRLARAAQEAMVANVDDYTARFIQHERDSSGVLGQPTVMQVKIQTRHQGGQEGSPMRVYLKFVEPAKVAGREVIWAKDLHNGKLIVHEAGLLGLVPLPPLDPTGVIAMQGQRFPIYEIGLTRLVEQLIERGEEYQEDPGVRVAIEEDFDFDGESTTLIQIRRSTPNPESETDFSLAEVFIDPERQLIRRYRSYGWPQTEGDDAPLVESYTYEDIQLNVGLSDEDFDPKNPEYNYP